MKHLKKDTGGYALLYVLVIVMVLVAISMMICTVALRNLQSQQAAVERMADKYAAQGEIEKTEVKIEALTVTGNTIDNPTTAKESAETAYKAGVDAFNDTENGLKIYLDTFDMDNKIAKVTIESKNKAVIVTAKLEIKLSVVTDATTGEAPDQETEYTTTISTNSTEFTSYTIETTGGDAG